MHVQQVLVSRDPLRIARVRRDEAVEALAEMRHRDRPRQRRTGDRQVEIANRGAPIRVRHRVRPGFDERRRAIGIRRHRRYRLRLSATASTT
jgi:hypothetical protein